MKYDPTRPMTDQITSHLFHFPEYPRDRNQFHALLQDLAITFGPALGWQRWPQDGQPLPSGYRGRGFYARKAGLGKWSGLNPNQLQPWTLTA